MLVTTVIVGILVGIAVSPWQRVVEGRQVDYATNQLKSDLRLVYTQVTNSLVKYQVVLANGSSG